MAVDNTLRYRGFNSYNLAPGETLYSSLSDCEYLGFVTTQWVALKAGGTIASGEVRITWIDDTGGQLGATERHTFTPTRLWERHTWTVAVPPEAVKLRIQFEGGAQGYHFACPMTEPGEIASSFDPNIASAVTWLTSEGVYTGMVTADQIVAGVLRAVAGDSGFDLEAPRIWMTSKDGNVTWEASPDNPLTIKDDLGNFLAGIIKVGEKYGLTSSFMSNTPDLSGGFANIGYGTDGGRGIEFQLGENKFIFTFAGTSDNDEVVQLYLNNTLMQQWGKGGALQRINDGSGVRRLTISDDSFRIYDKTGFARLRILDDGSFHIYDKTVLRLSILPDGSFRIFDQNNVARLLIFPNGNTFLQNAAYSHAIGVDNTGPYRIKNGVKTYF